MKKFVYDEQAVVRIWRNAKNFVNLPTSHFGHAAVTVDGPNVKSSPDGPSHIQNIRWKRNSALGLLYSRSALISEIDRNLAAFQRLTWKNNFLARFDALMKHFPGGVQASARQER